MIHEPNDKFDFSKLALCKPISNSSGSFFIKYAIGEQPLYIQTPKCTVKQMVTKTTGKKMYCDLIFQQENDSFIRWMENLETHTQQLLYDHRQEWFKTDLERDDIEQSFASPMKVVKSGKQYIVRANLQSTLKIYDENEKVVALDAIIENTKVMVILEIQGVRSGSNFQVDIEIKQMMVLRPEEVFSGLCIRYEKEMEKEKPLVNPPSIIEPSPISLPSPPPPPPSENIFIETTPIEETPDELCEVNIEPTNETIQLKERKEMYYQMYQEARQKAKVARDLALSAYLEAKQIKNKYMLDDILDSSSDESEGDDSDTEKTM
jgi:hypothetical protein